MPDRLARALLEGVVRHNPLFLLSALVLLVGTWLSNPPAAGGARAPGAVLALLAAVKAYEAALLGAAAVLARRGGLERDVRNLVLVLAPFLLDVSCTDALAVELTRSWGEHVLAIGALVAIAAGEALVAARLVGRRYDALTWGALLSGPLAAHLLPLVQSWAAHAGLAPAEAALATGLGLAGLVLAVAGGAGRPGGADLRALAPVLLGVAGYHALANAWTHSGSVLLVLGPTLIALGAALPRLGVEAVAARLASLALPLIGALLCGVPGLQAPEAVLGASAWQVGLTGLAVVHGVVAYRDRSLPHALGLLLALDLAAGGATLGRSAAALGHGPAEPALLLVVFAAGVARGVRPAVLAAPLLLAAACVYRLHPWGRAPLDAVLALDLVGLGTLAWAHRAHGVGPAGARWRLAGVLLLVAPVHLEAAWSFAEPAAAPLARATLAALLLVGLVTRVRAYAIPALLLPVEAARAAAPSGATGWGGLVLGGAFALVAAGVAVSLKREALLAWLSARPGAEGEDAEAGRPAKPAPGASPEVGAAALRLGGAVALVLLVTAVALPNHIGEARGGEAMAIGVLKDVYRAQTYFREHDADGDGVLDYAASVGELQRVARLVDGKLLALAEVRGYRVQVCAHPAHPEFMWMAVANPVGGAPGQRSFATNHTGVIVYGRDPIPLDPCCTLPATTIGIGR